MCYFMLFEDMGQYEDGFWVIVDYFVLMGMIVDFILLKCVVGIVWVERIFDNEWFGGLVLGEWFVVVL